MNISRKQLSLLSTPEVIQLCISEALLNGTAESAAEANKHAKMLSIAEGELRMRGMDALLEVRKLTVHSEPNVRLWAASILLDQFPDDMSKVLNQLCEYPGRISIYANLRLRKWRKEVQE